LLRFTAAVGDNRVKMEKILAENWRGLISKNGFLKPDCWLAAQPACRIGS